MNPWLTEEMAEAHVVDLLRAADRHSAGPRSSLPFRIAALAAAGRRLPHRSGTTRRSRRSA